MDRNQKVEINLLVDEKEYEHWKEMADILCLNIYEYIRRCTNAHTNILAVDSFKLVPHEKSSEER